MSTDDSFRITAPCPLPLSQLSGDGPQRHCAQCDRTVHDLSALTRRQAARLRRQARRSGERLCGILRTDHTGRARFQPSLLQRLRAAPALAVLLQPGGCPAPEPPPPAEEVREVQIEAEPDPDLQALEALRYLGYIE